MSIFPKTITLQGSQDDLQAPKLDWTSGQVIAISASSAASSIVNVRYNCLIELSTNANCWYTVGLNPTAEADTDNNQYLAAGATRYVFIPAGDSIAFIQDGSSTGYVSFLPTAFN